MTTEGLPSWRYEEGGTTGSWEGGDVGSPVSGFVIHAATGEGPDAHTHPYPETFIVIEGSGRFRHDNGFVEAHACGILVVPRGPAHDFKGLGPGMVRMVGIRHAPRMDT